MCSGMFICGVVRLMLGVVFIVLNMFVMSVWILLVILLMGDVGECRMGLFMM